MKQLYLTYCSPGEGLEQGSGRQLRAASNGLSDMRVRRLRGMMGYSIPNISSQELTAETAPIRLAFLADDSTPGECVLVHACYVGEDPASGRLGNYFAHLLTDLPRGLTARDAILAWRSSNWITSDDGGPKELPDMDQVPVGMLDDEALFAYVKDRGSKVDHLESIAFLANAVLIHESHRAQLEHSGQAGSKPIFLVATPDDAAMLLYGATRILPRAVFRNLTFSVYDEVPDTLTVLTAAQFTPTVTATWRPGNPAYELPERFYTGVAVTLNLFNGRRSTLSSPPALLDDAVSSLAAANLSQVDRFHALCDDLELTTLAMVEVAFALSQGKTPDNLTVGEMEVVAQSPALVLYLAKDDRFFKHLFLLASDKGFREHTFIRICNVLHLHADDLATLTDAAVVAGDQALLEAKIEQAALIYETLLPMIDPEATRSAHQQLLARLAAQLAPVLPREGLALGARLAALEFSAATRGTVEAGQVHGWLEAWVNLTPVEVPEVLQRLNEIVIRKQVACLALTKGVLTAKDLARLLAGSDLLLLNVYLGLARDGQDDLARRLLVVFAPPPGGMSARPNATPENRLMRALSQVASASTDDAAAGLAVAGPVLEDVAGQITAENFFLPEYATLIDWVDHHRPIIPEPGLSHATRDQYWAWNCLNSIVHSPRLSENVISALPLAFTRLPALPESAATELKRRLTRVITSVLAAPVTMPPASRQTPGKGVPQTTPLVTHLTLDQQMDVLERVCYAWGPTLGDSAMGWYCDVLTDVAFWNESMPTESLLSALVLLGLRGARTPELADTLRPENLKPYLNEIISHMGRHNLDLVTRAARSWPEPLEEEWKLLATTNNLGQTSRLEGPRDLWRRLRSRG